MNKYKKLAKAILSIDEQESNLKISKNKLEDSIAISNEFYDDFFSNLHVPNIDSKVAIYRRGYLEDYNGTCTVNRYLGNRAIDFKIFIPKEEDIISRIWWRWKIRGGQKCIRSYRCIPSAYGSYGFVVLQRQPVSC